LRKEFQEWNNTQGNQRQSDLKLGTPTEKALTGREEGPSPTVGLKTRSKESWGGEKRASGSQKGSGRGRKKNSGGVEEGNEGKSMKKVPGSPGRSREKKPKKRKT